MFRPYATARVPKKKSRTTNKCQLFTWPARALQLCPCASRRARVHPPWPCVVPLCIVPVPRAWPFVLPVCLVRARAYCPCIVRARVSFTPMLVLVPVLHSWRCSCLVPVHCPWPSVVAVHRARASFLPERRARACGRASCPCLVPCIVHGRASWPCIVHGRASRPCIVRGRA